MMQTLNVPVISLSASNIHKLKDITSEDLYCLWTVFSKCKENLENGRRLENMSWRLWYRESLIERSVDVTPIPIQGSSTDASTGEVDFLSYGSTDTESPSPETPTGLRHVSSSSFKRIIFSFADTSPLLTPRLKEPLKSETWPERPTKFYVSDDEDDEDDDQLPSAKTFVDNGNIDDDVDDDDDQTMYDSPADEDNTLQSTACSNGFKHANGNDYEKRTPQATRRPSILTTMLSSKPATIRRIPHVSNMSVLSQNTTQTVQKEKWELRALTYTGDHRPVRPSPVSTHPVLPQPELSVSLQHCVDWEQRQNKCTSMTVGPITPDITPIQYSESFQSW